MWLVHCFYKYLIFIVFLTLTSPVSGAVTFYSDEGSWTSAVGNSTSFDISATNIVLANEIVALPGADEQLGSVLSFDAINLPASQCYGMILKTIEVGAGFTFDDGVNVAWDDALSVGDIDSFEDDDFEVDFPVGREPFAFGVYIYENSEQSGEVFRVYGADDITEIGMVTTGFESAGYQQVFVGVTADEPIGKIVFEENPSGDDMGFKDLFITDGTQYDADSDGLVDCDEFLQGTDHNDSDSDNDGFSDGADVFPNDPNESSDYDNDGIGDNTDWDDDNDGVPDTLDIDPLDDQNTNEIVLEFDNVTYKGVNKSVNFDAPESLFFHDDFDGATLAPDYTVLNADTTGVPATLGLSNGMLEGEISSEAAWFQAQTNALYIYQTVNVTSFRVTTLAKSRDASNINNPVQSGYHYAGPMIRSPDSDIQAEQDFVFAAVGYQGSTYPCANGMASLCYETKSTTDSAPIINRITSLSGDAEIRLCKLGDTIHSYIRDAYSDDDWTSYGSWNRPDLRSPLQVGVMSFSFLIQNNDTQRFYFDYLTIETVDSISDCLEK